MKKFHFQDGLKQRFWRTSRIVVALLVLFEISALQHFYYQNQQVSAIEPDIALLKKLKTERVPDATHTASLVFMGDIMLARGIGSSIDKGINPFAGVQEKLDEFDMRIANLETTLANPNIGSPASKPYTFNSSISALDTLKNARLDVASLANNHTGDFGRLATSDTVTQFKNAGLNTVGAGDNIEQAFKPLLIEKNGISFGFIAVNDIELAHTKVGMQTPGSAYFDRDLIKNSIDSAKLAGADFIVVIPHWGVEYSNIQSSRQQEWGRFMIDAGADLVVGSHPHVIQPSETYNGKQIVYSLGNFIFDGMSGEALNGQMISVEVQKSVVKTGTNNEKKQIIIKPVSSIPYKINSNGFPIL